MSTVRMCTTPEEGWGLYSHFLGNLLLVIRASQWDDDKDKNEDEQNLRDRTISDAWSKLVGSLYMIMRRMKVNGYEEDASKMQQIIDMTVELDLTNPETHQSIHDKYEELKFKKQGV
jgi:hypothetical protein